MLLNMRVSVLLVLVLCNVLYVSGACPTATTKWSTWSGRNGNNIVIEAADSILLDVSTNPLTSLTIKGKLVFDASATQKIVLTGESIIVDGGELWIGSEDCPFNGLAEVVLTGNGPDKPTPGTKVLGATNGGKLNLHGAASSPWTNLTITANKGDTNITLRGPLMGWNINDTIVIAPTAFYANEIEERQIAKIVGNTIFFDKPLDYLHYSNIYRGVNGEIAEMRAEVTRINRNVIVRGDASSETTKFGGHTICYTRAECKFSNVLFRECGQSMVRARYPVHFHNLGNYRHGGYAKNTVVYNSYSRAYTIHYTNYTLLEDNTAYKAQGHNYFIEDGNEFYNDLIGNLAIDTTNAAGDLTGGDKDQPSSFWITNPMNRLIGNHAVGATFGFWYAMPYNPIGLASGLNDMWPRFLPVLEFDNNVAHTMKADGLFIDRGVQPDNMAPSGTFYQPSRWDYLRSMENKGDRIGNDAEPILSYLTRFTAYKCNGFGAWLRGYNMEMHYPVIVDTSNGIEYAGGNNRVVHGFIVGVSDNWGTNPQMGYIDNNIYGHNWGEIAGFHFYHGGGPTHVVHTTFQSFDDITLDAGPWVDPQWRYKYRRSIAIKTDTGGTTYPSHDRFYNLTFSNVTHKVWFNTQHEQYKDKTQCELSPVLIDRDGTLTGVCGSWIVGVYNPVMITPRCTPAPQFNGYTCPPDHTPIRQFEIKNANGPGIITRLHDKASFNTSNPYWSFHLVTASEYLLQWTSQPSTTSNTPDYLEIQTVLMTTDEYVTLAIPYKPGSTVTKIYTSNDKFDFTPVNSKAALNGYNYYWDSAAGLLWIKYIYPSDNFLYQRDYVYINNGFQGFDGYKWIVKVQMNCGGSCQANVNPSSLSGEYKAAAGTPKYALCGDLYAYGLPQFTVDNSVAPLSIFGNALADGWTTNGIIKNKTEVAALIPNTTATNFVYTENTLSFTAPSTVDISKYTHLSVDIVIDSRVGERTRACILVHQENSTTNKWVKGFDTDLCNPFYTPFPPLDIWEWRTVFVPLAALRIPGDAAVVERFSFGTGGQFPYRPTAYYLANFRLVKATSSIKNMGNDKWLVGRGGDPDPIPWSSPLTDIDTVKIGTRLGSTSPTYRIGPSTPSCFWREMLSGNCTASVYVPPDTSSTGPTTSGVPTNSPTSSGSPTSPPTSSPTSSGSSTSAGSPTSSGPPTSSGSPTISTTSTGNGNGDGDKVSHANSHPVQMTLILLISIIFIIFM